MMSGGDGKAMLAGVRVIDLTSVIFGPYATQTLADLGADVIKVEPPAGDSFRMATKPGKARGLGSAFMAINRGKRSIALDLKADDDRQVMQALLADADVFILNVRGKAAERLGLDYASVKAIRPDIIYVHCVGFGQDGPYADLPAYDDVIQATTGATTLQSRVDGDPAPRYLPTVVADKVAGLHAAYAVLAAIIHKLRTGEGQYVEVPMLETFAHFLLVEHLGGLTFVPANAPAGYPRQLDPDRQPVPTADGHVSLVHGSDSHWFAIFDLLGAPEVLEEAGFSTPRDRFFNTHLLYRRVAQLTGRFSTAELLAKLHAAQIPAMAVRDLSDVLDEPHLKATGFFRQRDHPDAGPYIELQPPVRFGAAATTPGRMPPMLDADGAAIRAGCAGAGNDPQAS